MSSGCRPPPPWLAMHPATVPRPHNLHNSTTAPPRRCTHLALDNVGRAKRALANLVQHSVVVLRSDATWTRSRWPAWLVKPVSRWAGRQQEGPAGGANRATGRRGAWVEAQPTGAHLPHRFIRPTRATASSSSTCGAPTDAKQGQAKGLGGCGRGPRRGAEETTGENAEMEWAALADWDPARVHQRVQLGWFLVPGWSRREGKPATSEWETIQNPATRGSPCSRAAGNPVQHHSPPPHPHPPTGPLTCPAPQATPHRAGRRTCAATPAEDHRRRPHLHASTTNPHTHPQRRHPLPVTIHGQPLGRGSPGHVTAAAAAGAPWAPVAASWRRPWRRAPRTSGTLG